MEEFTEQPTFGTDDGASLETAGPMILTDRDVLNARLAEMVTDEVEAAAPSPSEPPPPLPVDAVPAVRRSLIDLAAENPEYAAELEAVTAERAREEAARAASATRQLVVEEDALRKWNSWQDWRRATLAARDQQDQQFFELGRTDPLGAQEAREAAKLVREREDQGWQQAAGTWQRLQQSKQQAEGGNQARTQAQAEVENRFKAGVLDTIYHESPAAIRTKLQGKNYAGTTDQAALAYIRDQIAEHRNLGYSEGYAKAQTELVAQYERDLKLVRAQSGLSEPTPDVGFGSRVGGGVPSPTEFDAMSWEQRQHLRAQTPNIDDLVYAAPSRR